MNLTNITEDLAVLYGPNVGVDTSRLSVQAVPALVEIIRNAGGWATWAAIDLALEADSSPESDLANAIRESLASTMLVTEKTLANWVSMGRAFPRGSRRWQLPISHYIEIAALMRAEPEHAAHILDLCEAESWTRDKLRMYLSAYKQIPSGSPRLSWFTRNGVDMAELGSFTFEVQRSFRNTDTYTLSVWFFGHIVVAGEFQTQGAARAASIGQALSFLEEQRESLLSALE